MRVLLVSNLFPPDYIGGYEIACGDVVLGLRRRGHDVVVVTSAHGSNRPHVQDGVHRVLIHQWHLSAWKTPLRLWHDIRETWYLTRLARSFRPNVVSVWNIGGLWITPLVALLRQGIPAVFAISDWWIREGWGNLWWPRSWHRNGRAGWRPWIKDLIRQLVRPLVVLEPLSTEEHAAHFFSHALREGYAKHGIRFAETAVIHHGVDVDAFPPAPRSRLTGQVRLLYVGQLEWNKGVGTALDALATLRLQGVEARLTIVGDGSERELLRAHARQLRLDPHVGWVGKVPREHLSPIYAEHDVLVFPSVWEEPFAITVLEAMSTGLVVVGTQTGGSQEVLRHEVTGLTFPPRDALELARQVRRLVEDPDLHIRLSRAGVALIREQFRLDHTVGAIEAVLQTWAARRSPRKPTPAA